KIGTTQIQNVLDKGYSLNNALSFPSERFSDFSFQTTLSLFLPSDALRPKGKTGRGSRPAGGSPAGVP
ncbi:hypothetical protein, partial [Blautia sp.]|uniref:hypothetical protein n=1 Tax=Blautia sp. TaxID=1955243 RepID=UPI0039931B1F